jgi:hypothetical protein
MAVLAGVGARCRACRDIHPNHLTQSARWLHRSAPSRAGECDGASGPPAEAERSIIGASCEGCPPRARGLSRHAVRGERENQC